ncbi:TIGR03084 family metal-binding protein [Gordonia zhaorongruii]|uniref:TIGR03084 family metal-binding protein n=1 Tax=Gordonia zhaorongruii TaxID=2597659 RepID=UPI0010436645|nr:TIGR03084 family metal-binding protein [Gordonia zhaorongruii]
MSIVVSLVKDLEDESGELDRLVATLDDDGWAMSTPAPRWTVAHQIGHLLWTDRMSLMAATNPDGFAAIQSEAAGDTGGYVDAGAVAEAARRPADLLAAWRSIRTELAQTLVAVPDGDKIPWFGPPMSAASMATARIMETWAHGLDVADGLGVRREPTDRLRNVAHLGVRTRDFAYQVNGLTPPAEPFRYELTAPSGETWTWGPDGAADVIRGPALDFCELVTQRRHLSDLDLEFTGGRAQAWAGIAQVFAGPPGAGRAPSRPEGS